LAIPDPIPQLTVNSVTYDFARVGSDLNSGRFQTADGLNVLTFAHQFKKRNRFSIRLDRNFVAADPFVPDVNQTYSHSVYTVVDAPANGVTPAENNNLLLLLSGVLTSGTPDYSLRWLQGEL
jgi:hypothetical protein